MKRRQSPADEPLDAGPYITTLQGHRLRTETFRVFSRLLLPAPRAEGLSVGVAYGCSSRSSGDAQRGAIAKTVMSSFRLL